MKKYNLFSLAFIISLFSFHSVNAQESVKKTSMQKSNETNKTDDNTAPNPFVDSPKMRVTPSQKRKSNKENQKEKIVYETKSSKAVELESK
jgi:hypothetical protein